MISDFSMSYLNLLYGLVRLALTDLDKWDKPADLKSRIGDSSLKCTEYLFPTDDCSSFPVKYCLKNS